ncbi:hypothetical protein EPI10_001715 [Gossypium australe]|uniref:Retrotransposon gag domain-containing protein n=1 Tax=Gossypium australe TaxID=47621 RepID=A0A5B6VCB7_9ROSI|nr:hypothetical protein EPI10_001715 [Gossypium australe]
MGAAARWYNQLSRANISSWRDLAQAFMKQYNHVTDMALDRITLQNMGKKLNESFRQYAQRWREVAMQVQPPLLEKETTMLFINTLKAPFITHMIGSTTKSFTDIVMAGEMIENAIRGGKIEPTKGGYSWAIRASKTGIRNQTKYRKALIYANSDNSPCPKWYDSNAHCDYHAGIAGHLIENCTVFKKVVERLIKMGVVTLDDMVGKGNPLPNHKDKGINVNSEKVMTNIKRDVTEVKAPLRVVWREMVKRGLADSDSAERCGKIKNYCEFQKAEGHEI